MAVTLAISPRLNGVLAMSSALKPCSVSMQVTMRDSRSCTRLVSLKWRGSSTNTPLMTPGPLPRSHCSSDTFFGPRFCFQSSSPFISNSSAGLPSCSISRYLAMPSAVDDCACAAATPSTSAVKAMARETGRVMGRSPRLLVIETRREPGQSIQCHRGTGSAGPQVTPPLGGRAKRGGGLPVTQYLLRRSASRPCCRSTSPRSCRPWRRP